MNILFACVAQSCSVDRLTNRLSIFNVVEQFQAPNFPMFVPEAVYVAFLEKDPKDTATHATLALHSGGSKVGETTVKLDLDAAPRTRFVINIQGIPILGPPKLEFHLVIQEKTLHIVDIPIMVITQPQTKG